MIYLLDTDTVSLIIKKNPMVIKNLVKHENDEICISAITYAEINYGLKKKNSDRLFKEVLAVLGKLSIVDFNDTQSELYGTIRLEQEKSGLSLPDMDMLIAAAALSQNAILISHNTKHFSKIKGLRVEDWALD